MTDRRGVEGGPKAAPLLTILIPSYNRGARVRALVDYLLPLVDEFEGRIELIVSNNKSTDGTERLLSHVTSPHFRLFNRERHVPTAEENIFESVELCRGEYVWFHGDDDIPNLDTVRSIMPMLETGHHDFLVFNSFVIDSNGGMTGGWMTPLNADTTKVDFVAGASTLGITFGFAGISNAIQRRGPITKADWKPITNRTFVYSHIAWWLVAFKGHCLTVVNRPLVAYRVDDSSFIQDHFSRVAIKADVPDYHFWTTGLMDLLIYLEDIGTISADHVRKMFECRRDGTYFRFMDNLVHMIRVQATLSVTDVKPRNRLSGAILERMTDWVLRIDPGYFECVQVIKDIHALRPNPEEDPLPTGYSQSRYAKEIREVATPDRVSRLSETFTILLNHKSATTNVYIGMVGRFMGYVIYRHISGLVAFDEERPVDRQAILRWLDIRPTDDTIILADTEERLRDAIRDARSAQVRIRQKDVLAPLRTELARLSGVTAAAAESMAARVALVDQDLRFQAAEKALFDRAKPTPPEKRRWRLFRRGTARELPGFDREFYLRNNPDVAEDGGDPVQHFLERGWKEGRDPSPAFDVKGYLAANPDVAAAGVNPLIHFLDHGRREGRRGWFGP